MADLRVEFGVLENQKIETNFNLEYTLQGDTQFIELVPNDNILNIGGNTLVSPATPRFFTLKPINKVGNIPLQFKISNGSGENAESKIINGPTLTVLDIIPEINFIKKPEDTIINCNILDLIEFKYSNPFPSRIDILIESTYNFNNLVDNLAFSTHYKNTPGTLKFLVAKKPKTPLSFSFVAQNKSGSRKAYPYAFNIQNPFFTLIPENNIFSINKRYKIPFETDLVDFDLIFVDSIPDIINYDTIINGYNPSPNVILHSIENNIIEFEPIGVTNAKLLVIPKTSRFTEFNATINSIKEKARDIPSLFLNTPTFGIKITKENLIEFYGEENQELIDSTFSANFVKKYTDFLAAYEDFYLYRYTQLFLEKEIFRDNFTFNMVDRNFNFQILKPIPTNIYEDYIIDIATNCDKLNVQLEKPSVMDIEVLADKIILKPKSFQISCYIVIEAQFLNENGDIILSKTHKQTLYLKDSIKDPIKPYDDIRQATLDKIAYLSETKNVDMETIFHISEALKNFNSALGFSTIKDTMLKILERVKNETSKNTTDLSGYNNNKAGLHQYYATLALKNIYELNNNLGGIIPVTPDKYEVSNLKIGDTTTYYFKKLSLESDIITNDNVTVAKYNAPSHYLNLPFITPNTTKMPFKLIDFNIQNNNGYSVPISLTALNPGLSKFTILEKKDERIINEIVFNVESVLSNTKFIFTPEIPQNLQIRLGQQATYTINKLPTNYKVFTNNVSIYYNVNGTTYTLYIKADKNTLGKFKLELYWDNYDNPKDTLKYKIEGVIV